MQTVNISLNLIGWRFSPEVPDRDGEFWVVTKYNDLTQILYTTDGGWNTHRKNSDEDKAKRWTEEHKKFWLDYIVAWTYGMPYSVEVKSYEA